MTVLAIIANVLLLIVCALALWVFFDTCNEQRKADKEEMKKFYRGEK